MKQKCNNDMEQRSEKVQKLLDEKPSWFMMWGIPILLILLMVIVCILTFVPYPDSKYGESILVHLIWG